MPRFSIAAAAANMAQYLSQSQNAQLKGHSSSLVDRSHLYWPGLQGLVTNPMAWRDRLTNSSKSNTWFLSKNLAFFVFICEMSVLKKNYFAQSFQQCSTFRRRRCFFRSIANSFFSLLHSLVL